MGLVTDPRQTDWRNGLTRMRAGQAERELLPAIARLDRGQRVLIITPVPGARLSQSTWARAVRVRTREWRAALATAPRLQRDRRRLDDPAAQEHRERGALRGALTDPHVQVVVVVDQRHDDVPRALEVQVRADEDLDRAGRDEPVDEVLGELAVDL